MPTISTHGIVIVEVFPNIATGTTDISPLTHKLLIINQLVTNVARLLLSIVKIPLSLKEQDCYR